MNAVDPSGHFIIPILIGVAVISLGYIWWKNHQRKDTHPVVGVISSGAMDGAFGSTELGGTGTVVGIGLMLGDGGLGLGSGLKSFGSARNAILDMSSTSAMADPDNMYIGQGLQDHWGPGGTRAPR